MKPLTEQQVRDIVKDEMQKNYMSGSPNIPPHDHNGTDGLNIYPANLIGFTTIPSTSQRYLNTTINGYEFGFGSPSYALGGSVDSGLVGGDGSHISQYINDPNIVQYPIPIVVGNGVANQSVFNGGYAPEGTMILFAGIVNPILYIRFDGTWRGVALTLTA